MKHKFLGLLAFVALLLLLAIPAAAQSDPDPCFDASMSKSQYAECAAGSGGGLGGPGPGGGGVPPCMSCVIGDWGDGYQSQCVSTSNASPSYAQYSNCQSTVYCWPGPLGTPICDWSCSGSACLRI